MKKADFIWHTAYRTIAMTMTPPAAPTVFVGVWVDCETNDSGHEVIPVLAISSRIAELWEKHVHKSEGLLPVLPRTAEEAERQGWRFRETAHLTGFVISHAAYDDETRPPCTYDEAEPYDSSRNERHCLVAHLPGATCDQMGLAETTAARRLIESLRKEREVVGGASDSQGKGTTNTDAKGDH